MADFDPGYGTEPFRSLCRDFPGTDVYPPADFRTEWGPIFHRGRLDGTAKLLVIGQDPAQNENVVRRILVGVAGQRAQGLLRKLGLTRSYLLINTFLYSVYGQAGGQSHAGSAAIADYRNQWIDAILAGGQVQAVLALGSLADGAWAKWKAARPHDPHRGLPYFHATHPTQPESASNGDAAKHAQLTAALLANWNTAIHAIGPAITPPDVPPSDVAYGQDWQTGDVAPIPAEDLPAGVPDWMGNRDHWAARVGNTAAQRRANITITVPADMLPSSGPTPHANSTSAPAARAMAAPTQPAAGLLALAGTVVTMDGSSRVLQGHTLYVRDGLIVDIRPSGDPAPDGFAGVAVLDTKGLIFPGLIDLHNHLAYDALPLWQVPKKFTNRDQWSGLPAYRTNISGPMGVIADLPGVLPALCRYVECKSLLGGATTTQGIALVNHNNVRTFFHGLARNVEEPDDPRLPTAHARIGDVAAKDLAKFRKTLNGAKSCFLLHLSEGTDAAAREHFLALHASGDTWALSPALAGIHCVALNAGDFKTMAQFGAAMVWSPMSNLLLYGKTAAVAAATAAGLRIGLGPDWSPSGSKNVLGELKAAYAYSRANENLFTPEELVGMVTRQAAAILHWDAKVGSLEAGKIADLLVVKGKPASPCESLIKAAETDVLLVTVGGVRRYGTAALMSGAAPELEAIKVGAQPRALNLWATAPATNGQPPIEQLSLADATQRLTQALAGLGALAPAAPHLAATARAMNSGWRLELDETEPTGFEMRPLVGLPKPVAARGLTRPTPMAAAAPKLSPIALDPLTVADEPPFLKALAKQTNLPNGFAEAVADLY